MIAYKDKGSTTILSREVGETPDVAQAYRASGGRHDKTELGPHCSLLSDMDCDLGDGKIMK